MSDEPVAWIRYCFDGSYEGLIVDSMMETLRKESGAWTPLFERDAEIARLREDAERYRWMRERHENTIMDIYNSISPAMISPELLDAAIDAARKDAK